MSQLSSAGLRSPPAPLLSLSTKTSSHDIVSMQCMRLHRPTLSWSKTDSSSLNNSLSLPASFGSVYLGESLSMILCCRNLTAHKTLYHASLQVELQTSPASPRLVLLDAATQVMAQLEPGSTAHWQIYHEVKELGVHTLLCTLHYTESLSAVVPDSQTPMPSNSPTSTLSLSLAPLSAVSASASTTASTMSSSSSAMPVSIPHPLTPSQAPVPVPAPSTPQTVRGIQKSFKFPVQNPLSVKTKVTLLPSSFGGQGHDHDASLALEIQMMNLTDSPLKMEEVRFEPNPCFSCQDMNLLSTPGPSPLVSDSIFGSLALFYPKYVRQYLFILCPKPEAIYAARRASTLGRLDVTWLSALGGYGRLQTSELQRKVPINESQLYCQLLDLPSDSLHVQVPFTCTLSMSMLEPAEKVEQAQDETAAQDACFELTLNDNHSKDMILVGECPKQVMTRHRHSTMECEWLPCRPGIHRISLTVKRKQTPTTGLSPMQSEPDPHRYLSVLSFDVFVAAT